MLVRFAGISRDLSLSLAKNNEAMSLAPQTSALFLWSYYDPRVQSSKEWARMPICLKEAGIPACVGLKALGPEKGDESK
jgi:hypothetical protein